MSVGAKREAWLRANRNKVSQYNKDWRASDNGKRKQLNRHLVRKYGITIEDKQAMWDKQQGNCAVCHKPMPSIFDRDCQVEHDHATNKVRSLAHWYCNIMVGVMENHPTLLSCIVEYLEGYAIVRTQENQNLEKSAEMSGSC